jgi:membrane fusion protein (multidrug efflux system)
MSTTEELQKTTGAVPEAAAKKPSPNEAAAATPSKPLFHRPLVVMIIALVVIAGLVFTATIMASVLTHETTDDAFIDAHVVSIAPKVSGKILSVSVQDNQEVKKNQPLFEIDPEDYLSMEAQKKASLEVAIAKQNSADASVRQSEAHMKTIALVMEAAKAMQDAAQVSADLAHSDLKRSQSLVSGKVVSAQDFEHTKSASDTADANLLAKVKEVDSAVAYVDEAKAQAASTAAQAAAAAAEVNEARAALAQSELQLSYTKVVAPDDARVTGKAVEPGDYVQVGQALMVLVQHDVWITANYKETQITHMRPGQQVDISVDAFPERKLRGHVDSIQAGSGARFSLLPPENATGNFVKVVQRVPVKIVFDEQSDVLRLLGPGMSAVPEVRVKDEFPTALVVFVVAGLAILVVIVAALFWLNKTAARNS